MKRILLIFILFVVLSGCASTHMNKGLQKLTGMDIETAFSVLGDPNEEHKYGAMRSCTFGVRGPVYIMMALREHRLIKDGFPRRLTTIAQLG